MQSDLIFEPLSSNQAECFVGGRSAIPTYPSPWDAPGEGVKGVVSNAVNIDVPEVVFTNVGDTPAGQQRGATLSTHGKPGSF
jgi:hypothetical protein